MNATLALVWTLLPPTIVAPPDDNADQPAKTGVVNIAKVFEDYQMTRRLEQRFDDERGRIADQADNRRQSIDTQVDALAAFDPTSQDYADRREQVRRARIEFRVWLEMEEDRLKQEHMAWLRVIYDDVRSAVAEMAEQRGLDLVLTYDELSPEVPDSLALRREILLKKVLYFSGRVDLSETVLEQLGAAYAKRGGAASLGTAPPAAAPPKPKSDVGQRPPQR